MGPEEMQGTWPRSLPAGVALAFQALDISPNDPVLTQYTISRAAGTTGYDINYDDGHIEIGKDPRVLSRMLGEASIANVPMA
jgi:hypothetical protein